VSLGRDEGLLASLPRCVPLLEHFTYLRESYLFVCGGQQLSTSVRLVKPETGLALCDGFLRFEIRFVQAHQKVRFGRLMHMLLVA